MRKFDHIISTVSASADPAHSDDSDSQSCKKRDPYIQVSNHKRRLLLYYVKDERMSIKAASDLLLVNYSTAKTILQLYRKTGRIDRIDKPELISK